MQLQIDKLGKVAVTVEQDYWSIGKDYDKLTIVEKAGIFGTYISRKPVPAGTELTDRRYWIPFSSLKENIVLQFGEVVSDINNLELTLEQKEEEIYKAMASLTAGGLVLKQTFGDSEVVGISQKAITKKIDDLQDQINHLHPGTMGVTVSAYPNIVYDDSESEVTITARMQDGSIADEIKIEIAGTVVASDDNVPTLDSTEIINGTVTVKAYATQDGFTYDASTKIVGTKQYYIGSGTTWHSVYNVDSCKQPIKATPAGTYNINVLNAGDYVWFIVPNSMTINKATMSGFTFPLEAPDASSIPGYRIYRSSNTYDAGVITVVLS